jgi:hypothetical protein
MPVFHGEMQLQGDLQRLPAVVTIDQGLIRIVSRNTPIGEWKLYTVDLSEYTAKSMLLEADDGQLILFMEQHDEFMRATAPYRNKPSARPREKLHAAFRPPETDETLGDLAQEFKEDFNRSVNPIIGEARHMFESIEPGPPLYIALAVLFALVIFLPGLLVTLATIVAFLALLVGGIAFVESKLAVRLPDPITPTNLIIVGSLSLVLAVLVALVR